MSLNSRKLLDEINSPPRSSVWAKIAAFVVITGILGWVLPPHPGMRMLTFIVTCIVFIKWLQKKS